MINELLEKRETLFEMAEVMYGENWLTDKKFWGSTVQRDLEEVHSQLDDMGFDFEITEQEMDAAEQIWDNLFGEDESFGDDEEDYLGF